jgi:hypothetical protein
MAGWQLSRSASPLAASRRPLIASVTHFDAPGVQCQLAVFGASEARQDNLMLSTANGKPLKANAKPLAAAYQWL